MSRTLRFKLLLLLTLTFGHAAPVHAITYAGYFPSGIPWLSIPAHEVSNVNIKDYGDNLKYNKGVLMEAIKASGANQQEQLIIMAIAMQETRTMYIGERDASKDWTVSANSSILNLNYHELISLGYTDGDYGTSLNDPKNLALACWYLVKGFRIWGIERTLNFHRGGSQAYYDGTSNGAADYRNAIYTIYNRIAADTNLMYDSRRVEIYVNRV